MGFSNKADFCLERLYIKSIKYVRTLCIGEKLIWKNKVTFFCLTLTIHLHLEIVLQGWVSPYSVQII